MQFNHAFADGQAETCAPRSCGALPSSALGGTLQNTKIELVCLVAYNETKNITGANEFDIKESIIKIIEERCSALDDSIYNKVHERILKRINYIIFPIWQFDDLLNQFTKNIGG
ncbi:MAG: hypothetical protein HC876_11730 [Chloroflexaceae bacterium]|nr:hypothetical protein [Chloroflexaceae bacterium]